MSRAPLLRDEHGHPVEFLPDGVCCPVPEHQPALVVDLHTATAVWEKDAEREAIEA